MNICQLLLFPLLVFVLVSTALVPETALFYLFFWATLQIIVSLPSLVAVVLPYFFFY